MLALYTPVTSLGMLWSSSLSLLTSVAAVFCDGTGRSLRYHHSSLIAMVGGVSSCHYIAGEGDDVAVNCGTVGVGEREVLYAPQDSDVARWLCDNYEES